MTDMDRAAPEDADKAPYARPVLVNMGRAAKLTESGALGSLNDGPTNPLTANVAATGS